MQTYLSKLLHVHRAGKSIHTCTIRLSQTTSTSHATVATYYQNVQTLKGLPQHSLGSQKTPCPAEPRLFVRLQSSASYVRDQKVLRLSGIRLVVWEPCPNSLLVMLSQA